MQTKTVLVVDDFEEWRQFVCSRLLKRPDLQIIGELSDGFEAVQRFEESQRDLMLLDIGLPTLNGIEVARRILAENGTAKILFLSEHRSSDIEEAFRTGAKRYVVKSEATRELLPAIEAVLENRWFISASLGLRTDKASQRAFRY